jgi:hypothetical protein
MRLCVDYANKRVIIIDIQVLAFAFLLIDYTVGAVLGVAFVPCKRCRSGMRPQCATLPTLHPPPIKGLKWRLTARGS